MRTFFRRINYLLNRRRYDAELEAEMEFHREMAMQAGHDNFGDMCQLRVQAQDAWGWAWLDRLFQDLGFEMRQIRRAPLFVSTAVSMLAIGIGVAVAMFGFVDAALLEPLPYWESSHLMSVSETSSGSIRRSLSYPDFLEWERRSSSFISLDVYRAIGLYLRTRTGTEQVQGERVSDNFFDTLGIRPILGHAFSQEKGHRTETRVVVISYGAWVRRFGMRSDIIGRTIALNSSTYSIIGILPQSFTFAPSKGAEFWVPIAPLLPHEDSRTFYNFDGIGRMRNGVTAENAQAELASIEGTLQQQFQITGRNLTASIVPLSEAFTRDLRPLLLTLLGGAGLVCLIACVGVLGLLINRSERYRRDVAIRRTLGLNPIRLVRHFVVEGLLFSVLGSLAGILVSLGLMRVIPLFIPSKVKELMPFLQSVGFNIHTLAFFVLVALCSSLLLTGIPALRLSYRARSDKALKRADGNTLFWRGLSGDLVVMELAVAFMLLTGTGLLIKSSYRLMHVPLGFDLDHLTTLRVKIPNTAPANSGRIQDLYLDITRNLSRLPTVESVGVASILPVSCNCAIDRVQVAGSGDPTDVLERHIGSTYLATLKAQLLRGRNFTDNDDSESPKVAIVNQTFAKQELDGRDPIGETIVDNENGHPTLWKIVGVVSDIREGSLDVNTWPAEYFPITQTMDHEFSLAVRSEQNPVVLLPALAATLRQLDPKLDLSEEVALKIRVSDTPAAELHRFTAYAIGGFATIAFCLGSVAFCGFATYSSPRWTREMARTLTPTVRRISVYRLILQRTVLLIFAGLGAGLICSTVASVFIRRLLFDVTVWDAGTLMLATIVLISAPLAGCFVVARRAASPNTVQA